MSQKNNSDVMKTLVSKPVQLPQHVKAASKKGNRQNSKSRSNSPTDVDHPPLAVDNLLTHNADAMETTSQVDPNPPKVVRDPSGRESSPGKKHKIEDSMDGIEGDFTEVRSQKRTKPKHKEKEDRRPPTQKERQRERGRWPAG